MLTVLQDMEQIIHKYMLKKHFRIFIVFIGKMILTNKQLH